MPPVLKPELQQHLLALFQGQAIPTLLPDLGFSLWLLQPDICERQYSSEQVDSIWQNMPYWAFAWSSGRALAQYILQNPEIVQAKSVVDFGSGSGIVGMAALKAGAKSVTMCDIDPLALVASEQNAELNGFSITTCAFLEESVESDMLVVGDILYDTRNHNLAKTLFDQDKPILWAESREQTRLADIGPIARIQAETYPNLGGFDEHKYIHIYSHSS